MNGRPVLDHLAMPPHRFVQQATVYRVRAASRAHFKRRWNGAMSQTEAEDLFRLAAPEYALQMARRTYLGRNETNRKRVAERYIVVCRRVVERIATEIGVDLDQAMADAFKEHPRTIAKAWAKRVERSRRRRVGKK